jgi:hypothetical protein
LSVKALLLSALAVGFMAIPFLGVIGIQGSDIFPPPKFPNNLLIWIFIAYMTTGALWLLAVKIVNPSKLQALSGNPPEISGDQK